MEHEPEIWTDPLVRSHLVEAGWHLGYSYDLGHLEQRLTETGFSVVEPALALLRQIGGLTIVPPRRPTAVFGSGEIVMDPFLAVTGGEAPRIKDRETGLGLALTPVGEWCGEYILLVAEDGSVLAETSFQFLRLGTNFSPR
jgi:hypothetical protein